MMRSTVVALVSFAAALMLLSRRPAATSSTPLVDANTPPATLSLGPSDAPHRLVIYSDYQCPACALLHREAEPALRELAESGPLRLELRHFPLAGHRRAPRWRLRARRGRAPVGKCTMPCFGPRPVGPPRPLPPPGFGIWQIRSNWTDPSSISASRMQASRGCSRLTWPLGGLTGVPALFLDGHPVTVRSQRGLVRRVKQLTRAAAP